MTEEETTFEPTNRHWQCHGCFDLCAILTPASSGTPTTVKFNVCLFPAKQAKAEWTDRTEE